MNADSGKPCTRSKYESKASISKGRSLEELMTVLADYKQYTPVTPEKVDVWMMGNLLYTILTDLYVFEKPKRLGTVEAARKMVDGEHSPIPARINNDDPANKAMMRAIDMCWTYNWKERPSAQAVSSYLLDRLRRITGEKDPDVRVTLPERESNEPVDDLDFMRAMCDRREDGSLRNNCM